MASVQGWRRSCGASQDVSLGESSQNTQRFSFTWASKVRNDLTSHQCLLFIQSTTALLSIRLFERLSSSDSLERLLRVNSGRRWYSGYLCWSLRFWNWTSTKCSNWSPLQRNANRVRLSLFQCPLLSVKEIECSRRICNSRWGQSCHCVWWRHFLKTNQTKYVNHDLEMFLVV